jgi:uncharacterized protein YjbJ (UPF0337 family)
VSQLPQSIKDTRETTTRYLEQKMPSTDSWLYKKTNFVDNPAVHKIVRVDQKALDEVGKIAPVTTSAGTLARDVASGQVDKLPGDIKESRQAMTDYFSQKMPSTNSALYKGTNFVDNSKVQTFIKADEKVLNEAGKIAPVTTSAGTLARDVVSGQLDKLPGDVKDTRETTTRYLEQKMPSTDSWLYKKTNFVDNPAVQKIVRVDQKALDEVGKIAPVTTSAGTLARDVASGQVDKLPGDIKESRQAMTDYFSQEMPSTNSTLYKGTNFVDNSKVQGLIKIDQKVLTAIENF